MTIHVFTPIMPHEGRVALKSIRKFNSITGKLEDNRVGLRDDGSKEGHSGEEQEDAKHLPNSGSEKPKDSKDSFLRKILAMKCAQPPSVPSHHSCQGS